MLDRRSTNKKSISTPEMGWFWRSKKNLNTQQGDSNAPPGQQPCSTSTTATAEEAPAAAAAAAAGATEPASHVLEQWQQHQQERQKREQMRQQEQQPPSQQQQQQRRKQQQQRDRGEPSCESGDCLSELVFNKEYCKKEFSAFDACFDSVEAGSRSEDECMPLVSCHGSAPLHAGRPQCIVGAQR